MRNRQARPTAAPPAGQAIVEYMVQRGFNQSAIARKLGIDNAQLHNTLRGIRYRLSPELVTDLADTLDVPSATRRQWLSLLDTTQAA